MAPLLTVVASCGEAFIIPDDCILFMTRAEGVVLLGIAQDEFDAGETSVEAFAEVSRECVERHCGDDVGTICALSCASCADDLVDIVYADEVE